MNINLKPNLYENHIEVSQRTDKYKMCCSIFAPMINVYSNTDYGSDLSPDEFLNKIDQIVDVAVSRGSLNLNTGGYYDKNNDLVSTILGRTELEFTKGEFIFNRLLEAGYFIQVTISVNSKFYEDVRDDNKLNSLDKLLTYLDKPTIYHTFNIKKSAGKYFIHDSYEINKKYAVQTEIKDMGLFKSIIGNNCSAFI